MFTLDINCKIVAWHVASAYWRVVCQILKSCREISREVHERAAAGFVDARLLLMLYCARTNVY